MNPDVSHTKIPVKVSARPKTTRRASGRWAFMLLIVLLVLAVTVSCVLYMQRRNDQRIIKGSAASSRTAAQVLVRKVSRLMILPAHETPTVATVSDFHKLPDQVFFKLARNGDKVLIYPKAQTAILYDPNRNIILAVSPLNTSK